MPSNYNKGRSFEYRVKKMYEAAGWFVIRAAGSKGVADLVAIAPEGKEIHFIQCKKHGRISRDELDKLIAKAYTYSAVPILAVQGAGKGVVLHVVRIDGTCYSYKLGSV